MVKNRKGYTLVEMIVVVAIIGIVFVVIPPIIIGSIRYFVMSKARLELQQEARSTMYIVTEQLHQAQSSTIVIDQSAGQAYYSRIAFTKTDGKNVSFFQQGKKMIANIGGHATTLSNNMAFMAFSFPRSDDLTIISISLTLQEMIYQGRTTALHMASERVRVMN